MLPLVMTMLHGGAGDVSDAGHMDDGALGNVQARLLATLEEGGESSG